MTKRILGIVLGGLIGTGCAMGSASIRYQDQLGGVLVLKGDEGKAMKSARAKMTQHCGANYQIVKRETVKVGSEAYTNTDTDYDEQTDQSRDSDSVAVAGSDTVSTHDSSTNVDDWGSDHASDSSTSTTAGAASSTREDETTTTIGGGSSSTVSGVRDVNEIRVHYRCGV